MVGTVPEIGDRSYQLTIPGVVEGLGQFAGDNPMLNAVASSFKIVLQSGLAVGALTATVMNLILPDP